MTNALPTKAHLSICILLPHQPINTILNTLQAIQNQHLLTKWCDKKHSIELILVTSITHPLIQQQLSQSASTGFQYQHLIRNHMSLSQLWNTVIHDHTHPNNHLMIIIDQPIHFKTSHTLLNMVSTLYTQEHPHAISLYPTQLSPLYIVRSQIIRQLLLPNGFIFNTQLIQTLLLTQFLSAPHTPSRITCITAEIPNKPAPIPSYCNTRFDHLLQLTLCYWLTEHLMKQISQHTIANYMQEQEEHNPNWFLEVIAQHTHPSLTWVVPIPLLIAPLKHTHQTSLLHYLCSLPRRTMATFSTLFYSIKLTITLKKGRIFLTDAPYSTSY